MLEEEIGCFIEFSTKVATIVEIGHYFWILLKICKISIFGEISSSSACTPPQALVIQNFVGVWKYCVLALSPINGFKIGPKAAKIYRKTQKIINFWTFLPLKNWKFEISPNFNFWAHNIIFWELLRSWERKLIVLSNFQQKL